MTGAQSTSFCSPDVVPNRNLPDPEPHYGNLFFDDIAREAAHGHLLGERLTFNFAYPNLYLVTDRGDSLLLTHGHYFEAFWSLTAELAAMLALDDLELEERGGLSSGNGRHPLASEPAGLLGHRPSEAACRARTPGARRRFGRSSRWRSKVSGAIRGSDSQGEKNRMDEAPIGRSPASVGAKRSS